MTDVLLIGGPVDLDGTKRSVDNPNDRRPLEFRSDSNETQLWDTLGDPKGLLIHRYILTPLETSTKTWWLAVHESMDLDSAIESILWSYP